MVNYHRHSDVSNIILPDSVATNEDYAKRAVELGHTILSSCEHGTQGRYRQCADLAKKYGLKWRYVAEVYFVKDRRPVPVIGQDGLFCYEKNGEQKFASDNTNCHMILAAKTEKGIGDLNEVISEAHTTGYYYRPRIDMELLMKLNPRDVFVTTACIGGIWQYDAEKDEQGRTIFPNGFKESDALVEKIAHHFGDSFMLEVQYHNTAEQKKLNLHILGLARRLRLQIIAGLDSHYIHEEDKELRQMLLESHHLKYAEEDGWYMDYPDDKTTFERFMAQGVLNEQQIRTAMDNTDIFETFQDVSFDKSRKIPSIYPHKTQAERNDMYRQLIESKWESYRKSVPESMWPEYRKAIDYEVDTITSTNTSDYFLLNEKIIKRYKELGGAYTYTGRGSAPSYFTNMLLGFTSIDRVAAPVTMYPDRFISAARLASGSLPDIDNNISDQKLMAKAQEEVVGEWHSAPMVAFGTLKRLSSWKMYCRASNVPFDIANDISEDLKVYELDYKHAEEEDRDYINPFDYVPAEYHEQLRMSEQYMGMIDSISQHPCAFVVCDADVRRQFGLIRLKHDCIAAFIDGATADAYGFVKNDLLLVDVVNVNSNIYKSIGINQPAVPALMKMVENDSATWDMYRKGYTMGLNQAERAKSTEKVMQYSPRNVSEMTAFCAGIRPGFASMAPLMFGRQRFSYNIPLLDKLIQTKEMPDSFILYQEQVMAILQLGGLAPAESYAAIKAIAKKHPEKVLPIKGRFMEGFSQQLIATGQSELVALDTTEKVWKIIEDNTSYSFNCSHAFCVALDSLYTAWAKAHYPYETYATMLKNYSAKGDKDKIDLVKAQMKRAFGIKASPCRFHQDNRTYYINKDLHSISDALTSIKGVGMKDAEALYELGRNHYDTFVDFLFAKHSVKGALNASVMVTLITLDYFEEFGSAGKLMALYNEFSEGKNRITPTLKDKTKLARMEELRAIESMTENSDIDSNYRICFEGEKLGRPVSIFENMSGLYYVMEIDDKFTPRIRLYSIKTGSVATVKIKKSDYSSMPMAEGSIIRADKWKSKQAYTFAGGKPVPVRGVTELWFQKYTTVYEMPKKTKKK